MSQVSYGTITITDTTDLTTYIRYAKYVPLRSISDFQSVPDNDTRYIAVLSIPSTDSIPAWNSNSWKWSEFIGSDGVSVTGVNTIYYLKTDSNPVQKRTDETPLPAAVDTANTWSLKVPAYSVGGVYWISNAISLSNKNNPIYTNPVEDTGLTNIAQNAANAAAQAATGIQSIQRLWYAKSNSQSISVPSDHDEVVSIDDYNVWTTIKPTENADYKYYFYCDEICDGSGEYSYSSVVLDTSYLSQYQIDALQTKVKNYWWDSAGAHIAGGTSNSGEISATSPISNYGYNTLTGLTGISFRYNDVKVVDLNSTTPSLDFYQPPTISGSTVTEGKKTMMLSANALRFYNPADGITEQAKLDLNGLKLLKGGIEAGTPGTNDFVYLSTNDYPLRQYVKTTDIAIDNQKTYYVFNNNTYTAVTSPDVSSISDYYECVQNGLTINEHTPTQNTAVVQGYILTTDTVVNNQKTYYTYDNTNDTYVVVTNPISDNLFNYYEFTESFTSDSAWREVIGSNFGVDNSGNLYASNAVISGEIHATSGTIAQGIIIGNADGAHITTTNEGIEFWNNGIKTAYINGNYMYIPYSVVLNEMVVGQRIDSQTEQKVDLWSWKKMSNENLRLMWLGGEV